VTRESPFTAAKQTNWFQTGFPNNQTISPAPNSCI